MRDILAKSFVPCLTILYHRVEVYHLEIHRLVEVERNTTLHSVVDRCLFVGRQPGLGHGHHSLSLRLVNSLTNCCASLPCGAPLTTPAASTIAIAPSFGMKNFSGAFLSSRSCIS